MMNQLEINLTLWAICSILLCELLFIICLCRCCFNRLKPRKFYIKREEYEYLPSTTKNRSTILRPPHADELAHIGTIRDPNTFYNYAFNVDEKDLRLSPIEFPSSTRRHRLDIQTPKIHTSDLPAANYEIHSYPYRHSPLTLPRPTLIDYNENQDEIVESYRIQCLRRPEILLPRVQRLETSTESYNLNYANIVPKSILKTGTNLSSSEDFSLRPYLQVQRQSRSPSTNSDVFTSSVPMKFANISQLNEIEWEIPREFQRTSYSNRQRIPSILMDMTTQNPWPIEYLSNHETTQQKAFEY